MPNSYNWGKHGGNRQIYRDHIYVHFWLNNSSDYWDTEFISKIASGLSGKYQEEVNSTILRGKAIIGPSIDLTPRMSLEKSVDMLNYVFDKLKNLDLDVKDLEIYSYSTEYSVKNLFETHRTSRIRLFVPVREERGVPYILDADRLAKKRYTGIIFPE